MPTTRGPATVSYTIVVTAVWVVLALVRAWTHEMWRDELQAWMIARSSSSVAELIGNLRYEGHPGLWPFCLFLISRLTDSPVWMQLLNVTVGAASVAILVRWAPFPRLMTAAIAFGYYVAYEYGTLSRSYGLGVLCVFAFCAVAASSHRRRIALMAVTLAGLAMTSLYGVVVAAGLGAGALWDTWTNHKGSAARSRRVAGLALVVALGMTCTLLFVRQPRDAGFNARPRLMPDANIALHSMGAVWRGLAPVPPLRREFWNRDILEPLPLLRGAAGVVLFAVVLLVLRRHPVSLLTFVVGGGGLFIFSYVVYTGGVRHHGHYFLLFVAACWLTVRPDTAPRSWARLLGLLAAVQAVVGAYASTMDLRLTFSGSRNAAAYIRQHYPPDIPIVVDPELPGVPIAAWLGREVFFAQSSRLGGFVLWNNQRQVAHLGRAVEASERLSQASGRTVLLVTTHRAAPPARFTHVAHFEGEIVKEETYQVYELPAAAPPKF